MLFIALRVRSGEPTKLARGYYILNSRVFAFFFVVFIFIGLTDIINAMAQEHLRVRYFPDTAVWYQDISSAQLDSQSSEVIGWLQSAGGWGNGGVMQIDFSIEVLSADASVPSLSFVPTEDHFLPDCDLDTVPVPPGGALEGESGYECESDGDCHLIVVHESTNRLFEMWRANIVGGTFYGGCLAVWEMDRTYDPSGRGEQCTSADAAGLPIAALLFSADEVVSGEIDHAIRFILPNSRIRNRVYVHPATHSTGATGGTEQAPPYGTRLRLRADFPLDSLPNEGARVVARAMQRYGMILADAGQIALTAQSDRFTTAKWSGLLGARDLSGIQVSDFEMIDAGQRFNYTGDCERASFPPLADIKANGSDGPVTISTNDTLILTVGLNAGNSAGQNADWWLVYTEGTTWNYYSLSGGWLPGLIVTYQGPLSDLSSYTVNSSGLSTGSYSFHFGVDTVANATVDLGQLVYDSVVVNVTSGILGTWSYSVTDSSNGNTWDRGTITFAGNYASGTYSKINTYGYEYYGTYTVVNGTNVTIVSEGGGAIWIGTLSDPTTLNGTWTQTPDAGTWTATMNTDQ